MFNPKHDEKMKVDFSAYRNVLFAASIGSPVKILWFRATLDDYLAQTIEHFARSIIELESFLDQAIPFDVIVVDTQLDTELEEYTAKKVLNLLIARKMRTPVILLDPPNETDRQFSIDDININELNIVGWLKKPIDHFKLMNMIIGTVMENQKNNVERKLVKKPKKVLLTVDDDSVRGELSDILSTVLLKGDVSWAEDIESIKKALDGPKQPDLIVIDCKSHNEMARDILKLILSRESDVPVVLVDSSELSIEGIHIADVNVSAHIARPLDRVREFCIFETILRGKRWATFPVD